MNDALVTPFTARRAAPVTTSFGVVDERTGFFFDGDDNDAGVACRGEATPLPAFGTEDLAVTGEVWLTGGRVDALEDRTAIAVVEGTAVRGGESMRFEGAITIGKNRIAASTDPLAPPPASVPEKS